MTNLTAEQLEKVRTIEYYAKKDKEPDEYLIVVALIKSAVNFPLTSDDEKLKAVKDYLIALAHYQENFISGVDSDD